ncbi:MAG: hypothetical protein ACOVSW_16965 [Candidatus Kapaibacteriota bacterium]
MINDELHSQAQQLLYPVQDIFRSCIAESYQDSQENEYKAHELHSRTKASINNDRIVARIKEKTRDIPNVVEVKQKRGGFLLRVIGENLDLYVRFKKLNRQLRTSNIPTQQALAFAKQKQLTLEELLKPALNLNAGYVQNRFGTELNGIFITCPNGKEIEWSIALEVAPVQTTPENVQELTFEQPQRSRLRIKPQDGQIADSPSGVVTNKAANE